MEKMFIFKERIRKETPEVGDFFYWDKEYGEFNYLRGEEEIENIDEPESPPVSETSCYVVQAVQTGEGWQVKSVSSPKAENFNDNWFYYPDKNFKGGVVTNFSRHGFNADQKKILQEAGYIPSTETLAPFFTGAEDFAEKIRGQVASVVCPMGILMEALASDVALEATIISWVADEAARKRGNFATTGIRVFRLQGGKVEKVLSEDFSPTVENDFKTGEESPYKEVIIL